MQFLLLYGQHQQGSDTLERRAVMTLISIETHPATGTRLTVALPRLPGFHDVFRPLDPVYSAWRRWRTERILANLPAGVLKDIGYPTSGDKLD
jgi:hypothetical protein